MGKTQKNKEALLSAKLLGTLCLEMKINNCLLINPMIRIQSTMCNSYFRLFEVISYDCPNLLVLR